MCQHLSKQFEASAPSKTGHIMEPRKAMLKVAELAGATFTLHDLRRTVATTAADFGLFESTDGWRYRGR